MIRTVLALALICLSAWDAAEAQPAEDSRWSTDMARAAVQAAIPQAPKDPTRPVYHFRPPAQSMNDICGAIYHNGYYHISYQYDLQNR